MIKKGGFLLLLVSFFLFFRGPVLATTLPEVDFFWAEGCPHCHDESVFLEKLEDKSPDLAVNAYEISKNQQNVKLLVDTAKRLDVDISGFPTPFTVVGDQYVIGFLNEETTGATIEKMLFGSKSISLPILGDVDSKNVSLPVLTVVVGLLDGFNPCAMWALLFLITLLLGMKDRKKMWILGLAFIITSGLIYFVLMSAWLNVFLLLGFVSWVRIVIGLVALAAGGYNVRDYLINKDGTCKVTENEKRKNIFERLKRITERKEFVLAVGGIILLAVAVNMVELVCSAGLPAVYTQLLVLNNLPSWQYYFYILLYIIFFMLDDILVFIIAMTTLKAVGVNGKYSRFSHLFGGVIMIIIGVLMLFKPELLMFG